MSAIDRDHLASLPTTSARIRYLYPLLGKPYSKTAKVLGIRPQHVRNVINTPVKNPKTNSETAAWAERSREERRSWLIERLYELEFHG